MVISSIANTGSNLPVPKYKQYGVIKWPSFRIDGIRYNNAAQNLVKFSRYYGIVTRSMTNAGSNLPVTMECVTVPKYWNINNNKLLMHLSSCRTAGIMVMRPRTFWNFRDISQWFTGSNLPVTTACLISRFFYDIKRRAEELVRAFVVDCNTVTSFKDLRGTVNALVTLTLKVGKSYVPVIHQHLLVLNERNKYGGSASLDEIFHEELYCYLQNILSVAYKWVRQQGLFYKL